MLKTKQNYLLWITLSFSLATWLAGILQPMLTITATVDKQILAIHGKKLLEEKKNNSMIYSIGSQLIDSLNIKGSFKVSEQTRTIVETAIDLYKEKYFFVALLVLLFSIVIPLIKMTILSIYLANKNPKLLEWNACLSKWSLADVFAIGIFIVFLAANSTLTGESLIKFHSALHSGFYWFSSYCILSMIFGNLLKYSLTKEYTPST